MSRPFAFKQFTIFQENAAMKVGTDSVLLGSWASVKDPSNILDIGCGTGILSLMMAQRYENAKILAIELDKNALKDAVINVTQSNWKDRIELIEGDFLSAEFSQPFDLILSNPPYFPDDTRSPISNRSLARNGNGNLLLSWFLRAKELLTPSGIITMILPLNLWTSLEDELRDMGLFLNKICFIKPKAYKNAHRVMLSISLKQTTPLKEELIIEKEKRHDYTDEYRKLTSDFYLDKD